MSCYKYFVNFINKTNNFMAKKVPTFIGVCRTIVPLQDVFKSFMIDPNRSSISIFGLGVPILRQKLPAKLYIPKLIMIDP